MSERIALGFCNNVDYEIVWNADVLQDLAIYYRIQAEELHAAGPILSERDLVISILGFMRAGSGGERFVSGTALIEQFSARFKKKITLGGTSVRAAIAMRKLGFTSALHLITQNAHVRRLIPADSPYVCSNVNDSVYPHLIVQFDAGDRIRAGNIDVTAREPDRLIYHCNADRIAMKISPDFAELIAGAQVLLISGFNAMQSEHLLRDRLQLVARMLQHLQHDASVFLEDGGYFDPSFRRLIIQSLGTRLNVYSMNEDELQTRLGRRLPLHDATQIHRALADLHDRIPARTLVVHTQHWAMAYGAEASGYAAALRAGVTMATTRFRHGDDFTLSDYRVIQNTPPSAANQSFAESINSAAGDNLFCVPVPAVEQSNATTIGLGDAFVGGFLPALVEN